ncbi:MAG: sensor histidine kinase [Anaerolineae bacterium]|nr:sensor histidine kinase [Anaerolineae bacterium]
MQVLGITGAFWDNAIVIVYFFYGLAFYSMGLALWVESGRASELGFARSMRLLAAFGLLHGVHQWANMIEQEMTLHLDEAIPDWLLWTRLILLVTSFIALLGFGEHLLTRDTARLTWRITAGASLFFVISCILVPLVYTLDDIGWAKSINALSRYLIGIPGALLTSYALLKQRDVFRVQGIERFVRDLTISAVAFVLYGAVGQVFTCECVVFPSGLINTNLFQRVMGFPVPVFQAAMAITVAIFMIRVLRALEVENQHRLEAAEQARQESEHRSREDLARLNAELQAANQETARLLREVQQRDERRGELIQRITTAQENERRRIARELHDGTGQILTGLGLGLSGTAQLLATNGEAAAQNLRDLQGMATQAIGELRHLINDLRPPQLDDMGLVAALRWQIENLNTRTGIDIRFEVSGDVYAMPPEVETTLFRIAQEGLNNVIKHARATHAWVTLDFDEGPCLIVRDDGAGFDPAAAFDFNKPRHAWGLIGMQERASLINADLHLESAPHEGTTLMVCLAKTLGQPQEQELTQEAVHGDPRTDN